jgi:toxin ParE1/3/4
MTFVIVIEPRALADFQAAIDYYDEQQTGLGKKFSSVLEKNIRYLSKNPYFKIVYKDYRILPLSKFPYIIFYYVNEENNTVYITAIFNTYQDPEKYPK